MVILPVADAGRAGGEDPQPAGRAPTAVPQKKSKSKAGHHCCHEVHEVLYDTLHIPSRTDFRSSTVSKLCEFVQVKVLCIIVTKEILSGKYSLELRTIIININTGVQYCINMNIKGYCLSNRIKDRFSLAPCSACTHTNISSHTDGRHHTPHTTGAPIMQPYAPSRKSLGGGGIWGVGGAARLIPIMSRSYRTYSYRHCRNVLTINSTTRRSTTSDN